MVKCKDRPVAVKYLHQILGNDREDGYTLHRREVPKRGGLLQLAPGQNADGYGKKITMDLVVKVPNDKREYRVYCTIYSNNGSTWINYRGERVHLRTHFQSEVLD